MTRLCVRASSPIPAVAVLALAGSALIAGCSSGSAETIASDPARSTGSIYAQLELAPGTNLNSVSYSITRAGGYEKSGSFSVQNSSALASLITPIPAGTGYAISLHAETSDGTTCDGNGTFDVAVRQTSTVSVQLTCHEAPRYGSVLVTGTVNVCPSLDSVGGIPGDIFVNASGQLHATAHDPDHVPAALSYQWTTDRGTLSDPSSANPTFTCTTAGQARVTIAVSDGDTLSACPARRTILVTCKPLIEKISHVVVIYLENHSFDNLYGDFSGAEGRPATPTYPQLDGPAGAPYVTLPQTDPHIPATLPNLPFDITAYVPASEKTIDLVHRFYQEQQQIDGGKMDLFTFVSNAKGLSMGYYPTAQLPLVQLINSIPNQATLCDHFFHAAFGGSFLNHQWLIAAATPVFPNAPSSAIAMLDASGNLTQDGFVTSDGYAVNTAFSVNTPRPAAVPAENLVPNQTLPTIGDRLSGASVTWAWYAGGWNNALQGNPDPLFQFHHQPFAYYANYADDTEDRALHLKDELDFLDALANGTLPAVSFVKPLGPDSEHPGYADLIAAENHTVSLVNAVRNSTHWPETLVIVTYDQHGGFWDHVAPPSVDRWGPGARVPAIIFSPHASGGVDHTSYDTTAILKLIEKRWGLAPLGTRDAAQADLDLHALHL